MKHNSNINTATPTPAPKIVDDDEILAFFLLMPIVVDAPFTTVTDSEVVVTKLVNKYFWLTELVTTELKLEDVLV